MFHFCYDLVIMSGKPTRLYRKDSDAYHRENIENSVWHIKVSDDIVGWCTISYPPKIIREDRGVNDQKLKSVLEQATVRLSNKLFPQNDEKIEFILIESRYTQSRECWSHERNLRLNYAVDEFGSVSSTNKENSDKEQFKYFGNATSKSINTTNSIGEFEKFHKTETDKKHVKVEIISEYTLGNIIYLNHEQKYGFIKTKAKHKDVYFRYTDIVDRIDVSQIKNKAVEFELVRYGDKFQARNIKLRQPPSKKKKSKNIYRKDNNLKSNNRVEIRPNTPDAKIGYHKDDGRKTRNNIVPTTYRTDGSFLDDTGRHTSGDLARYITDAADQGIDPSGESFMN